MTNWWINCINCKVVCSITHTNTHTPPSIGRNLCAIPIIEIHTRSKEKIKTDQIWESEMKTAKKNIYYSWTLPHTNWDIFRSRIFVSFIKLTLLCVFFMDILTIRTTKSERNIVCMLSAHKFESNDISNAPQTQNNHDFFFTECDDLSYLYPLCFCQYSKQRSECVQTNEMDYQHHTFADWWFVSIETREEKSVVNWMWYWYCSQICWQYRITSLTTIAHTYTYTLNTHWCTIFFEFALFSCDMNTIWIDITNKNMICQYWSLTLIIIMMHANLIGKHLYSLHRNQIHISFRAR